MDEVVARSIAISAHRGQRTRFGEPLIEHVTRVAAAVPGEVRSIAWLHDVLERSGLGIADLCGRGLNRLERDALRLLTRSDGESYHLHALRIAFADGDAGRIARCVKLADVEDHLAHARLPLTAPPYAWARRQLLAAQLHRHEAPSAATAR
jgi:hypothetical protein